MYDSRPDEIRSDGAAGKQASVALPPAGRGEPLARMTALERQMQFYGQKLILRASNVIAWNCTINGADM